MKKHIKLFVNNNIQSKKCAKIAKEKLEDKGFKVVEDDDFEIAIAIGGDGSFIRMIKENNYREDLYYVGINAGHLGFLQEVTIEDIDKFIKELIKDEFKVENIGIQETKVYVGDEVYKHHSLNEIVVRDENLDLVQLNIYVNDDFLEDYVGDGLMICTSVGSTAHNLSYGGSIVFPHFNTLQITSMAPIQSKRYSSIINSIIIPNKDVVKLVPKEKKNMMITVDGQHIPYENVDYVESTIGNKHIKCLRFSHYNFPQKINDKLLSK